MRRTAIAVALAAATTLPGVVAVAGPASAGPAASVSAAHSGKPAKPAKPAKKAKFTATGVVTAVAGGTVTVKVKGGTKDLRGTTVTVVVPSSARVQVNGARKAARELAAGDAVTITGTRADGVLTATRVQARRTKVRPTPAPSPSASPSPSRGPNHDDDDSGDDDGPTAEPSETPHG